MRNSDPVTRTNLNLQNVRSPISTCTFPTSTCERETKEVQQAEKVELEHRSGSRSPGTKDPKQDSLSRTEASWKPTSLRNADPVTRMNLNLQDFCSQISTCAFPTSTCKVDTSEMLQAKKVELEHRSSPWSPKAHTPEQDGRKLKAQNRRGPQTQRQRRS